MAYSELVDNLVDVETLVTTACHEEDDDEIIGNDASDVLKNLAEAYAYEVSEFHVGPYFF